MRPDWPLDPTLLHLNHGSFGAAPRAVLSAQQRWRDQLEADPTGFFEDHYPEGLERARAAVARFVGADPAGLVFVANATHGVASIVGSLDLDPGAAILTTDHVYNAVRNTLDVAAAAAGATVVTATVDFPAVDPAQAAEAVLARVSGSTRLVVVDHVTSPTGLVLPVERIVAELEPEIPVLVDGAHAPGMVPLDLRRLGASFYAGNLHKWVCAPKGAGFLWVAGRHRDRIRPRVISHGWNTPRGEAGMLHRLFDWTGTFDPSPWLSAPDAIETMAGMDPDGWPGVMRANRSLALAARDLLCDRLGIEPPAPDAMIGALVALPLHDGRSGLVARLRRRGIVAMVSQWPGPGADVLRVSAQRYNQLDDYRRLADALVDDR